MWIDPPLFCNSRHDAQGAEANHLSRSALSRQTDDGFPEFQAGFSLCLMHRWNRQSRALSPHNPFPSIPLCLTSSTGAEKEDRRLKLITVDRAGGGKIMGAGKSPGSSPPAPALYVNEEGTCMKTMLRQLWLQDSSLGPRLSIHFHPTSCCSFLFIN